MQNTAKSKRRNRSTMSRWNYLYNHILFNMFLFSAYIGFSLIVPFYDYSPRNLVLCMILSALVGIPLNIHYNRCWTSIIQNGIIGIGLCSIGILKIYTPTFVKWLLGTASVLSMICIVLIAVRKVNKQKDISRVILCKFRRSLRQLWTIATIMACVSVSILPLASHHFTNNRVKQTSNIQDELKVDRVYGDEYSLSNNIDTLKLIRNNETFQSLSFDTKCDVLNAVVYCEARYLGLSEINVKYNNLENALGTYNHSTRTITINAKQIRNGDLAGGEAHELLNTVLHECRHSYQCHLVEMYYAVEPLQRNLLVFTGNGVDEWAKNMKDYHSYDGSTETFVACKTQPLERDAADYSQRNTRIFLMAIDDALEKKAYEE